MSITNLIRTLRFEIFKNLLLISFFRAGVLFFITDMVKGLFDMSYVLPYLVAGGYFVFRLIREIKNVNIKIFEDNNPEIKEMLSTAADNLDKDNIVVLELFKEVMEKVRRLSSGSIIVPGTILFFTISLPVLAIIDYEMSPLRIDALSQDRLLSGLDKIISFSGNNRRNSSAEGQIMDDSLLNEDIYGERRMAQLGNQNIDIKMSLGYQTDLTKPKEEDKNQAAFKDYPPGDNAGELQNDPSSLRENIVESDLAKKYNEKIRALG